jgi:hypothetical protein
MVKTRSTRNWLIHLAVAAGLGSLLVSIQPLAAQSSALSYHGFLTDQGRPANAIYDLRFTLYDAATDGWVAAEPVEASDLSVTNGLFTVTLDFGAEGFDGGDRWLEIAVRPGASSGDFTNVVPRQKITATPYAIRAANFSGPVEASQIVGTISASHLSDGMITSDKLAAGAVAASLSAGDQGGVVLDGSGVTNLDASKLTSGTIPAERFPAVLPAIDGSRLTGISGNGTGIAPKGGTGIDNTYSNVTFKGTARFGDVSSSNLIWFAEGIGTGLDRLPVGFGQTISNPYDSTPLDEPRSNIVTRFHSINADGSGNQINTNMFEYSENIESGWQNYAGRTQTEYHKTWNSPYTKWGTNFGWRFFGINFVFDTATREFVGADGGYALDVFKIENPRQAGTPAPAWSVTTSPTVPYASQIVHGAIYAKPVAGFSQGTVEAWGGGFTAYNNAATAGDALYYYPDNNGYLGAVGDAVGTPFNFTGHSTWTVKSNTRGPDRGTFIVEGNAGVGGQLYVTNSASIPTNSAANQYLNGNVFHRTNTYVGSIAAAPANKTTPVGWMPLTNAGVRYYVPLYQ